MRWLACAALLAIAACGGGQPTSFGLNVTVDARAVAASDRGRITTARLTVDGDELYTKSFDISSAVKSGEVRFRYIPAAHSGQITLTLDAEDAAGDSVASGTSDPVTLAASKAVNVSIVLGAPAVDLGQVADLGSADLGDDAGTLVDLAPPADLSPVKVNCLGMGACVFNCINGGSDINTCSTQCSMKAKPGSASKWNNTVICGQNYCIGDTDMMSGRCVLVSDPGNPGSMLLCDPGITFAQCTSVSYVSTSCVPCLDQARNRWFEDPGTNPPGPPTGMCSMPASADCTGANAMCMTQFNACLSDP